MKALRPIVGVGTLTIASIAFLGALDARTSDARRAKAEREELRSLHDFLPPSLRAPEFRLERGMMTTGDEVPRPWILVRDADDRIVAIATIASAPGYNDAVIVQALGDTSGRLLDARILSHAETPAYTGNLDQRWQPTPPTGDAGIDQLSGATVSAHALSAATEAALAQARQLLSDNEGLAP